jgi:Spy/CpxP family protein refolding chaperone
MFRPRSVIGVLTVALLVGWLLAADTKSGEEKKDPDPKAKGQLRANWKKLGLSDDQVQKIYKVQGEYRGKIDVLEQKIKELREEQYAEELKVLTAAQKARLKELGEFKDPTEAKKDEAKKDDPKKDEPKKDEKKP